MLAGYLVDEPDPRLGDRPVVGELVVDRAEEPHSVRRVELIGDHPHDVPPPAAVVVLAVRVVDPQPPRRVK
ncbi:MAG TPA: hypothetical protein VMU34_11830 [Mycobacterium sp.]|nr:hypothetical protein [Mycobacterium sp.]